MIPFNKPYLTGRELEYIAKAHKNGQLAGDGEFTKLCSTWLKNTSESDKVLLTHSCTAALEMSAILANIEDGDEVIMPSYTFVSTANSFVMRGATPVFVDIRPDTLNIDESLIESAITHRTKAIVVVHYAGVACEMDVIMKIASKYNLLVIEDAAQALMATYKGRPLGSLGDFGCYSFHETKNIVSGEGGALLINNPFFNERAEIIREKGTNRSVFFRGQIDKYTWVDVGSSYLPGEIISAFLWGQIEKAEEITACRMKIWRSYYDELKDLESLGMLRMPIIPDGCKHNAHMFYVLLSSPNKREKVLNSLKEQGVGAVFHYVPLHSSPAGIRYGRAHGSFEVTNQQSMRIIRLPLWVGMSEAHINKVVQALFLAIKTAV